MVWPCGVEPLQARACICSVSTRYVEPAVTPLRDQLALWVAPASRSGRCTEGANSQPNENELLALHGFQADLWPHCHCAPLTPSPRHTPVRGQQRHRMGNAHQLQLRLWVHLSSLCISTR